MLQTHLEALFILFLVTLFVVSIADVLKEILLVLFQIYGDCQKNLIFLIEFIIIPEVLLLITELLFLTKAENGFSLLRGPQEFMDPRRPVLVSVMHQQFFLERIVLVFITIRMSPILTIVFDFEEDVLPLGAARTEV